MFSRLRLESVRIEVVVLVVLNVAVSVFVVPDVAPGTIPDTQSLLVFQRPEGADELQVPLAASAGRAAAPRPHKRESQIFVQAGRTLRRPQTRVATVKQ
jgi:hypothetical protein